ncbi:MAG UNVERIFIED_CONTAM: hypothetical protein LVQ98_06340 [Rickettsiaceae bacterium]
MISANSLWNMLENFIKSPNQGSFIKDCTILEEYYDGFLRSINLEGEGEIKGKNLPN